MLCTRCALALARVLWCLAAFTVAWATHGLPPIDGAGVPWVLTWTHQRHAAPKQGGGDIREPTLCGWCCYIPTHSLGRAHVAWVSDDSFSSQDTTGLSLRLAHTQSRQCTGLVHPSQFSALFDLHSPRKLSQLPATPTHSLRRNHTCNCSLR